MPVMYAAAGSCHVYVDADVDLDRRVDIAVNSKDAAAERSQRGRDPLVHSAVAPDYLPRVMGELLERGVELRVDGARLLARRRSGRTHHRGLRARTGRPSSTT